jgi:putative endonuclease
MYYVYILKSSVDNNLYTGFSGNLKKRIREHELGNVDSTKNRRPLKLIYYEAYQEKEYALRREKFLKTTKGKLQLKKQLSL